MQRGLDKTAPLWPEVREAAAWGREAAEILANPDQVCGAAVRARYEAWLRTLTSQQAREGWLGQVATTFLKVSANYLDGLFHCYDVPDLPATNNDLERRFGTLRYHERRASGRRAVSGRLVLRGAVRVVAILSVAPPEQAGEQLRLKVGRRGSGCESSLTRGPRVGVRNAAFVVTRRPTWPRSNNSCSSRVCRRGVFLALVSRAVLFVVVPAGLSVAIGRNLKGSNPPPTIA